jgi:outer membrane protein TolC
MKEGMMAVLRAGVVGVLVVALGAVRVAAEETAAPPLLTLQTAITTALRNHPSLQAAKGVVQGQQALVGVARSNYFPQINFGADYRHSTNNFSPAGDATASINSAVTLQQLILDFGKTGADVEAARENLKGGKLDEENFRQTVAVNVKVTYFALLAARHLLQVQEETVRQSKEHLDQTEGFYQAGTRTRFDVTNAEVTLTNAQLNLIRARNAVVVARVALANAMGVPDQPIGDLEELLTFEKFEVSEEQALKEGLAARPDLLALSAQRQADEAVIRSVQRTNFPVLSGVADYSYSGQDFHLVHNWGAGLQLSFPIFSGFYTQSQIALARSNLVVTSANEEGLRQDVILAIHAAYSTLQETEERVRTSEVVVRQAQENLDLANGRFQAGIGTSIEQTDAQVLLANAKTSRIQALFDYRVAAAALEKAMGRAVP